VKFSLGKKMKLLHYQSGLRDERWQNGGSQGAVNFDFKQTEINVPKDE
jgi:hypothetical protein